jgi:hypothetical protein
MLALCSSGRAAVSRRTECWAAWRKLTAPAREVTAGWKPLLLPVSGRFGGKSQVCVSAECVCWWRVGQLFGHFVQHRVIQSGTCDGTSVIGQLLVIKMGSCGCTPCTPHCCCAEPHLNKNSPEIGVCMPTRFSKLFLKVNRGAEPPHRWPHTTQPGRAQLPAGGGKASPIRDA